MPAEPNIAGLLLRSRPLPWMIETNHKPDPSILSPFPTLGPRLELCFNIWLFSPHHPRINPHPDIALQVHFLTPRAPPLKVRLDPLPVTPF